MADSQLSFQVVYTLGDDFLDVAIPEESIREDGPNGFVKIETLPFFGATTGEATGYFVVPEGVGSLIHFRPRQPDYRRRYSAEFYGPGAYTFDPNRPALGSDRRLATRLNMPVFGQIVGDAGFLTIVTRGALDAEIDGETSFKDGELNRMAAQFTLRRAAPYPLRRSGFATRFEPNRIRGERTVRYVFLPGPGATYVDLATAYRRYLQTERGVARLADAGPPLQLRVFMGIEKWAFPFPEFYALTTFDQVRQMLDTLARDGAERAMVTLIGWEQGGYAGRWPFRLPPDSRLGGLPGLRALADYARARGHRLTLEDQYIWALERAGGFLARDDVTRGANLMPMASPIERVYILNAQRAWAEFISPEIPRLADAGVTGILVQGIGNLAIADYNEQHPLTRQEFVQQWRQAFDHIQRQTGWVGVVGPNDYVLGGVSHLEEVPLDRIDHQLFDETVPFLPIVVHGLVTYTGLPINLRGEARRDFLRQIEYGALPSFELTYRSPAPLGRTLYNDLYSSELADWQADVVAQYRLATGPLGNTWTQFIVDHRRLAPGVFDTTYEDGTRVVVNYGDETFRDGIVEVPGGDYRISPAPTGRAMVAGPPLAWTSEGRAPE